MAGDEGAERESEDNEETTQDEVGNRLFPPIHLQFSY